MITSEAARSFQRSRSTISPTCSRTRRAAAEALRTPKVRAHGPKRTTPRFSGAVRTRTADGGGGIRTLVGGISPETVFETAAFNRSATPPGARLARRLAIARGRDGGRSPSRAGGRRRRGGGWPDGHVGRYIGCRYAWLA